MPFPSRDTIAGLWPRAPKSLVDFIAARGEETAARFGIDDPLELAHFFAQISHESGGGTIGRENMSYTAGRIMQVFGVGVHSARVTRAEAVTLARNPAALAERVYGLGNPKKAKELGNSEKGDGFAFRGGGLIQLTGRRAYAKFGAVARLPLERDPHLIEEPDASFTVACAEFADLGCLAPARADDVEKVTKRVNGGYNGLADRKTWLVKWKKVFGVGKRPSSASGAYIVDLQPPDSAARVAVGQADADGDLRFGMTNDWQVRAMQARLAELGYALGDTDGDFGTKTRDALLAFQADNEIPTSGIADELTRAALTTAKPRPQAEARVTATAEDLRAKGSQTVSKADKGGFFAKALVALGLAGGGEKVGAVDAARQATDGLSVVGPLVQAVQGAVQVVTDNLFLVLIIGGAATWWFFGDVIRQRVADHRAGRNLGA